MTIFLEKLPSSSTLNSIENDLLTTAIRETAIIYPLTLELFAFSIRCFQSDNRNFFR